MLYLFLSVIFLIEGPGLPFLYNIAPFIIFGASVILVLFDILRKNKLVLPLKPLLFYALFLVFSALSTFFSTNRYQSSLQLLLYLSFGLFFIYCYNHRKQIKQYFVPFIYLVSFIYVLCSFLVDIFFNSLAPVLVTLNSYQFIFARHDRHNHLGDFLVLPMSLSVYYLLSGKRRGLALLSLIVFLPFFLYSYSLPAYIVFLLCILVQGIYFIIKHGLSRRFLSLGIVLAVVIVISLFFLHAIQIRGLFQGKESIVRISITSIEQRPLLGVGPGNFVFLSYLHFQEWGRMIDSSKNIFLDIFVENGVLAGVSFLLFLFASLYRSRIEAKLFFLFAAMVLLMQADYLFKMPIFMLLFFVLLSLISSRASERPIPSK